MLGFNIIHKPTFIVHQSYIHNNNVGIARLLPTFVLDGLICDIWMVISLDSKASGPCQEAQDGFMDDLEMELERMMDEPWSTVKRCEKKQSNHQKQSIANEIYTCHMFL